MSWQDLQISRPEALAAPRSQAHFAAQVVTALATTHLAHEHDYGETCLFWDDDFGGFVGRMVGGLRAGLALPALTWHVLDVSGARLASLPAHGRTLAEGMAWMQRQAALLGLGESVLTTSTDDLPEHPLAAGASFDASDVDGLSAFTAWTAAAWAALLPFAHKEPHAGPLRCWPHHFDCATLLNFDPEQDGAEARSVNVGFAIHLAGIAAPYFYVTAYPLPDAPALSALPALSHGHWQTEPWFGAILTADELPDAGRRQAVDVTLADAIAAGKTLIGASS
ncbi:MAG: hypothetical protein AAFV53_17995 [Myxococcota bacterium]